MGTEGKSGDVLRRVLTTLPLRTRIPGQKKKKLRCVGTISFSNVRTIQCRRRFIIPYPRAPFPNNVYREKTSNFYHTLPFHAVWVALMQPFYPWFWKSLPCQSAKNRPSLVNTVSCDDPKCKEYAAFYRNYTDGIHVVPVWSEVNTNKKSKWARQHRSRYTPKQWLVHENVGLSIVGWLCFFAGMSASECFTATIVLKQGSIIEFHWARYALCYTYCKLLPPPSLHWYIPSCCPPNFFF